MFLNIKQIAWNSKLKLQAVANWHRHLVFSIYCVFAIRSILVPLFSCIDPATVWRRGCLEEVAAQVWPEMRLKVSHARSGESRQHEHKPHLSHAAGRRGSRLQPSAPPVNLGRARLRQRGAPHIFIIPRVSAWVLEFQVCLERIPHGEAAAAEVEILMRWVFTSSKRKPQSLNPLLDLKSSSIGDSVHRPYDFSHISVSWTSHWGKRFAG